MRDACSARLIAAPDPAQFYCGGVYGGGARRCSDREPNHAMVLVGQGAAQAGERPDSDRLLD